jgi:ABC-type polysaccharide/polyol phosphate transport system ATPase subunit
MPRRFKGVRRETLFSDVELNSDGERIAVIGDNGAAKSTMIKLISRGEAGYRLRPPRPAINPHILSR